MPRHQQDEDDEMDEEISVDEDIDTHKLTYDPDQDAEERRRIRRTYRQLQEDENLQNAKAIGVESLTQKVLEADKLFEEVRGPQEATLDSAFLITASNLGAQKARQMKADVGFDIDDFVAKLVTFMGGRITGPGAAQSEDGDVDELDDDNRSLDWDIIGRKALAKSRRVPAMDFMLGPLSIEPKKRNVAKRGKQEKANEVETRPQEISVQDISKNENETSNFVAAIERFLEKLEGPINFFELIINPKSFGQSVENIFYLSFLIRDGKVALDYDEDTSEPQIYVTEPPNDKDYAQGLRKKQMIMELDVETWKRAIEVFDIKESTLPHRNPEKKQLRKDQWYG